MTPLTPAIAAPSPRFPWRIVAILLAILLVSVVALGLALIWVWHQAQPNARQLVIDSLEQRLNCKVEIDHLDVSLHNGVQVSGSGLRIASIDGQSHLAVAGVPMLTAQSFAFATSLRTLLFQHPGSVTVHVHGVIVTVPPAPYSTRPGPSPRLSTVGFGPLTLHRLIATDARLILETGLPQKSPTEFDFREITLDDTGHDQPFAFTATLAQPAPIGLVHATGHLGPWSAYAPRQTPIQSDFRFTIADLSYQPGLTGSLDVAGHLSGTLGKCTAQATAESSNFALTISAHPVPIQAEIQATLDESTGDLTLHRMNLTFLHSAILAQGSLTANSHVPGHTTALQLAMEHAREEDIFTLLSKSPPLIRGALTFHGQLLVPPGPRSAILKSRLTGIATISAITWLNPTMQNLVDSLSLRAQGDPKAAKAARPPILPASLTTHLALYDGVLHNAHLIYTMPGASILVDGTYPLTANFVDFHGVARTAATLSQMSTGWQSLLLKPVSPFFKMHGAGAEIPVRLTGPKSAPKFAIDFANRKQDRSQTENTPTVEHK